MRSRRSSIPADLGAVFRTKDTVEVTDGYEATYRGHVLKTQLKGLTLRQAQSDKRGDMT